MKPEHGLVLVDLRELEQERSVDRIGLGKVVHEHSGVGHVQLVLDKEAEGANDGVVGGLVGAVISGEMKEMLLATGINSLCGIVKK